MALYSINSKEYKQRIESFGESIGHLLDGGSDVVTEWLKYDPPHTGYSFLAIGSGINMYKMNGDTRLEKMEIISFSDYNMENIDDPDEAAEVTVFLLKCIDSNTRYFLSYNSNGMFHL